ncbi:MAG: tRNA (adenosine(37)-N6)-threonylcarbamoyltransferase complex dimerization subunit type 1 TsaB [Ignavibacteriales bacterium]|nr:MAG: tRNA (adenosine(37)-N6)-threonylcarbamoyltransferase complex dimerization subunit type 1 TsaB [Ignavibacteriales bacterium]
MNNLFPILAVETSGDNCSVALLFDDQNFIEMNYQQKHIHSKKIIEMIDTVLKNAQIELNLCKAIAVSMGPGSFTGLRIGLSTVKGLAFGANIPIIPVPTFDAYAFHISKYIKTGTKFVIAMNANGDEYYFSKYIKLDENVEVVDNLQLVEKNNLQSLISIDELVYGDSFIESTLKEALGLTAVKIGRWAYLLGYDLLTSNYDYLEPNYFKKFVVKGKG